jgi:hypothetical protein
VFEKKKGSFMVDLAPVHCKMLDMALPLGTYIIRLAVNGESTVRVVEVVK